MSARRQKSDSTELDAAPSSALVAKTDPAEPDMAWVLRAPSGAERERRMAVFQARVAAAEAAAAAITDAGAKIYQMSFWPDDKRAMPSDFIACALFAAVQTKSSAYLRGEQIASINGFTILFTGKRMTQVHADVLMGVAFLAREEREGYVARFQHRKFLRLLGREIGTHSRKSLRQLLDDLTATAVRVTEPDGNVSLAGSLLGASADKGTEDDSEFAVVITRDLCKMFERGFAQVDWQQRLQLKKKPLAQWLQLYFSQFHRPVAVKELHRLSGSVDELRFFRRRLKREIETLETIGAIQQAYIDDDDVVHVAPAGKPLPARFRAKSERLPPGASDTLPLPLPGIPAVSDRTMSQFRELYPDRDGDKCLADWRGWHGSRNAKNPDAAFLGFAKKWAQ